MFNDWLLTELNNREWSQADLARASGLTTAAISKYINGRIPDKTALQKIAKALNYPPTFIFRKAGILPPQPEIDEMIEQILHEAAHLTTEDQQELLAFIRMKRKFRQNQK